MTISIDETVLFDNCKIRRITVIDAETIAASGSLTTDDIMPYIAGGEGYNTLQLSISGTGTLAVTLTGSADGTTYGSVFDSNGLSLSAIATGLLAVNDGRCITLNLPLLAGAKLTFTETGGSNAVVVSATLCCKAD